MTDEELCEIGRLAFERHEGRAYPFEGLMPWVLSALRDAYAAGEDEPVSAASIEALRRSWGLANEG